MDSDRPCSGSCRTPVSQGSVRVSRWCDCTWHPGLSFGIFETLKRHVRQKHNLQSDRDIPTAARLAAGAFAGLAAQSITYPLDIVRRRSQVRVFLSTVLKHIFGLF